MPLGDVVDRVLSASPAVLVLVMGLSLVQAASGAIRLWLVFPSTKRPRLFRVARAFSFGQLVNMYVPGRAGDAFKAVSIARGHEHHRDEGDAAKAAPHGSASIADTTGALLADRGLDVGSLVLLCAAFGGSALVTVFAGMVDRLWMVGVGAALVASALVLVRRFWPSASGRLARLVVPVLSAMRGALSAHRLAAIVGIALVGWVAELIAMMVLASELGFHLSLAHSVVALFVLNVGIALPVTVANVGAFETAAAVGLAAFGVPMAEGIAIGTVLHAGQIAAVIIGALAFWFGDRRSRRAKVMPASTSRVMPASTSRALFAPVPHASEGRATDTCHSPPVLQSPNERSFLCKPSRVMPSDLAAAVLLLPCSRSASMSSQRST